MSAVASGRTLWQDASRRLRQNRLALAAAALVSALVCVALLTPWLAPYSPYEQSLRDQCQPPSTIHWLGTDLKGRDLLSRVMFGSRISLAVGVAATAVSVIIGVLYGAVAGYSGGLMDAAMMRFVDVLYGLPYMFLVILLMTILGRNLYILFIALGAVQWLTMARIVRGQVLSIKERDFVAAATAVGADTWHVMWRHLIPNVLGPVVVYATLTVPSVMLQEAFLSFLGLGVQAPAASWGSLAAEGAAALNPIRTYWWLIVFPGGALAMTLLALNFLGDGLRDALDPRETVNVKRET